MALVTYNTVHCTQDRAGLRHFSPPAPGQPPASPRPAPGQPPLLCAWSAPGQPPLLCAFQYMTGSILISCDTFFQTHSRTHKKMHTPPKVPNDRPSSRNKITTDPSAPEHDKIHRGIIMSVTPKYVQPHKRRCGVPSALPQQHTKPGSYHSINLYCAGCDALILEGSQIDYMKECGTVWSRGLRSESRYVLNTPPTPRQRPANAPQ